MYGEHVAGAGRAGAVCSFVLFAALGLGLAEPPGAAPAGPGGQATREVTVWVGDPDRRPVAGAGVEVLSTYRPIAAGVTDEEGRAVVAVPVEASVQWVVALKPGVGFDYMGCEPESEHLVEAWPPAIAASELDDEITLTLDGARTIRIGALDETGAPVPGVRFVPWLMHKAGKDEPVNLSGSRLASEATDEHGVAVFEWVPGDAGDIPGATFLVQGGEYHWPHPPPTPFVSDGDEEVSAILLRKTAICGQVRYPDGTPAPGVNVLAQGRGDTVQFGRGEARTDEQGRYSIEVAPEQTYTIVVLDPDWTARLDGVAVLAGTPVQGADMELSRGTILTGLVTDGSDGSPVVGELVYLAYETPASPQAAGDPSDRWSRRFERIGLHRSLRTNERGRFAFRVPPGRYQLCTTRGWLNVDTRLGGVHQPLSVVIEGDAPHQMEYEFTGGRSGPLVSSSARVKANEGPVYDYAFEWVDIDRGSDGQICTLCHSSSRRVDQSTPPRAHGSE